MRETTSAFDPLVAQLHAQGRLRVWSLVITIFGDAVQPRGGVIALEHLQQILARLRIEPGAVRTAMSRLSKEGWLLRERQGRRSYYRLSPGGIAEFGPAAALIYAPRGGDCEGFVLAASTLPAGEMRSQLEQAVTLKQGLILSPGSYIWTDRQAPSAAWLAGHGLIAVAGALLEVPEKAREGLMPPAQRLLLARLIADFTPLMDLDVGPMAPVDAMALRILLIHRWRRICLRFPEIPPQLAPKYWPGIPAHMLVADLYQRVLEGSETWLSALDQGAALPKPSTGFWQRFDGLT